MIDDFLKQLKTLKSIKPDREYSEKSLRLIFASSQNNFELNSWRALITRIGAIGTMVAIALLVVAKSPIPMKVAGLDAYDLRAEAQILETNLNIAEIKESGLSVNQTNAALEESAKSDPGHLNTTILKRESGDLTVTEYHNDSIDKALEESSK